MKLVAKVKLLHDPNQAAILRETMITANRVCNYISDQAWEHKTFRQFPLHKLTYHDVRKKFPLTAQVVVRCISKVADAYKRDTRTRRVFRLLGAITYDNRILSYHLETSEVSIWTVAGRLRIPFACGERQRELLKGQRGESDLVCINDQFYLFATCDVEEPEPANVEDVLGVDLGIVNLASDSDGENFSGDMVERNRRKYEHRRRNLQRKGTKSAKRKLKKLSGRQARFQTYVNHVISKRLVQKAQGTGRAIALEDLKGIRDRVTVRRKQRSKHSNWSFFQLRNFIEYKAKRAGVPVILVDPKNTSRTCPVCGCIDKNNRKTQAFFSCVSCGYSAPADTVAARNIRARAVVNLPMVSNLTGSGTSCRL
jgi:IS605 OrfB family transposase